jgi:hypothetical protein
LKIITRTAYLVFIIQLAIACQSKSSQDSGSSGTIPEFRKTVKKEPIAEYREKVNDKINDWYFSVQLLETSKTFNYLIKMQYEEVRGEDTIKIPDFGIEPKLEIRKGKEPYSCIIGFLDKENRFMEYKEVSVQNGTDLKLTTIKHYTVVNEQGGK